MYSERDHENILTMASETTKYLGINITKKVKDFYNEFQISEETD